MLHQERRAVLLRGDREVLGERDDPEAGGVELVAARRARVGAHRAGDLDRRLLRRQPRPPPTPPPTAPCGSPPPARCPSRPVPGGRRSCRSSACSRASRGGGPPRRVAERWRMATVDGAVAVESVMVSGPSESGVAAEAGAAAGGAPKPRPGRAVKRAGRRRRRSRPARGSAPEAVPAPRRRPSARPPSCSAPCRGPSGRSRTRHSTTKRFSWSGPISATGR